MSDTSSLSSSGLSSPPSTDDELQKPTAKTLSLKKGKLFAAPPSRKKKNEPVPSSPESEPAQHTRELSPPHEYVLADNPHIAVIVMFRSRFAEAFPKHVPNLGPQDIEFGVLSPEPSEQVEQLLCGLLGLVLNRKKHIERGHHGRALEEAISTQKHQWPSAWGGENPLKGDKSFSTMDATERVTLLKALADWSLVTSEVLDALLKDSYKQTRHEDDLNQPRSVQPWGTDGRKRRYWLIEGQVDTAFRLYRESPPKIINKTWWSIAGTIDELKAVGEELRTEGSQAARRLADRISQSIPRLEQSEEKRRRKEYRQSRKAAFSLPESGVSLYEGRTRGKRMRYTFSDDEGDSTDTTSVRRSGRHSDRSTPAEPVGSTITASGRQVKSKYARGYGERLQDITGGLSDGGDGNPSKTSGVRGGDARATRSGRAARVIPPRGPSNRDDYNDTGNDESEEEEDEETGDQWSGDDNDFTGKHEDEDDEDDSEDSGSDADSLDLGQPRTLIVRLKTGPKGADHLDAGPSSNGHALPHVNDTDELDPGQSNTATSPKKAVAGTTPKTKTKFIAYVPKTSTTSTNTATPKHSLAPPDESKFQTSPVLPPTAALPSTQNGDTSNAPGPTSHPTTTTNGLVHHEPAQSLDYHDPLQ